MKKEYYVVDEDTLEIKKALLDLESNEWHQKFESEDGVQYKDSVSCSRCKLTKYYNELTNDERIRTGKAYKEQDIFNNIEDAKARLRVVIKEKSSKIKKDIDKLEKEREKLINMLFNV